MSRAWGTWAKVLIQSIRRIPPLQLLVLSQSLFFIAGKFWLDFNISWIDAGAVVLTAVVAELTCIHVRERGLTLCMPRRFSPVSALATALGIAIFLRASSPWYFVLAGLVAIGSKHIIRARGRHIFNPSNIAIVLMVFLFPYAATIEVTQWGTQHAVFILISVTVLLVAYFARALLTTFSFLVSYTALLYILVGFDANRFSLHHYGLFGPTLMLFAAYMITDPKTSPQSTYGRVLHGVSVACMYFVLEYVGVAYALFVSSFVVTILNFLATLLYRHRPSLPGRAAPNIVTAFLSAGACAAVVISVAALGQFSVSPLRISPSFVLFGLESAGVKSCRPNPVIAPDTRFAFPGTPHTAGSAWGDYDSDGFDDIFISNTDESSRLFKNMHNGTFSDVTEAAQVPPMRISSASFVDYDNNGTLDLIVLEQKMRNESGESSVYNIPRVFKNANGTFVETTAAVGLSGVELGTGTGLFSFADYDGNGYLDMVVATLGTIRAAPADDWERMVSKVYLDPFFAKKIGYTTCGGANIRETIGALNISDSLSDRVLRRAADISARTPCVQYVGSLPLYSSSLYVGDPSGAHASGVRLVEPGTLTLFENRAGVFSRNERFTSAADAYREHMSAYIRSVMRDGESTEVFSGRYYQPVSFDYDADGRPDILVSADFGNNLLLRNMGRFGFTDETQSSGMTSLGSGMGATVSDWNGDGRLDVAVSNNQKILLYSSIGHGKFINQFKEAGLSTPRMGWGLSFFDYDLDGWEDLFVSNGAYVNYNATAVTTPRGRALFLTDTLYQNQKGASMRDMTAEDFCPSPENGYTIAVSDFDNDGDPDIFSGTMGSGDVIYKNSISHVGLHYLKIALEGTVSNRMGVGAEVAVKSAAGTQKKVLLVGSGTGGENSQTFLFGLGAMAGPVDVLVTWPSGAISSLRVDHVDRLLHIKEGLK